MKDNTKFIGLDLKKFRYSLSDFKYYIYPYQQMNTSFRSNGDTAKTSCHILS